MEGFAFSFIPLDILIFIIFFLRWISSGKTQTANTSYSGELERGIFVEGVEKFNMFFSFFACLDYIFTIAITSFVVKYFITILNITLPHISVGLGEEQTLFNCKEPQCTNQKVVGSLSRTLVWGLWASTSPLTVSIFVQNCSQRTLCPTSCKHALQL